MEARMRRFACLAAAGVAVLLVSCAKSERRAVADTAAAQDTATTGGPSAAPDSALLALSRRGWESFKRKDVDAFVRDAPIGYLYVTPSAMYRPSHEDLTKSAADCETRSYAIDSAQVTPLGRDGALLAYRVTLDQTCGRQKTPSPEYFMEAYERRGGQWQAVAFVEMPIRK
jgi:Domain of unknown function (DUF4440)